MVHRTPVCFAENVVCSQVPPLSHQAARPKIHTPLQASYQRSQQRLSSAFRDNKMASFEPTSPELSAHDVLAFSDAELVHFMEQNRCPDGGFDLAVAGWDTLPKDQRERGSPKD